MALEAPGQAGGLAPDACAEPGGGGGGWGGGLSRGRGVLYGMGERRGVVRYGGACYPRPQPKINGPSQTPTPPLPSRLVKLIGDICGTGAGMHRRGGTMCHRDRGLKIKKSIGGSFCWAKPRGGRPLGSGRQLPPQLTVGRRPLGGGGGGGGGGAFEGGSRRGGSRRGDGGGGLREGRLGGGSRWGDLGCWGGGEGQAPLTLPVGRRPLGVVGVLGPAESSRPCSLPCCETRAFSPGRSPSIGTTSCHSPCV